MSSITVNQVRSLQTDPTLQEVVKCSSLRTPELEFIPARTIGGIAYEFWRRTKKIDTPIYVKETEGVAAAKAGWSKDRRELAKVLRKMESDAGAVELNNNGTPQALDVWDETRMEEMENIRRKQAKGVYVKEDEESSPYNLEDFAVFYVDASKKMWNGEADLDSAALLAAGGLTTVYLVNASLGGLHWSYGNDREFNFGDEQFVDIRDEDKSTETGENCTYPGVVQYVDSYQSIVAKCEFDVIAITNVPKDIVDNFYLDNVLRRVTDLVYDATSVSPNMALMPSIAKSNWFQARAKQSLENGGCSFAEVNGSTSFDRVPLIEEIGVAVITTPNIPDQAAVVAGNVTATNVLDTTGEVITS